MKYSIIVPIYNAERTLDRCISSIRSQTITEWELLLIDDGSTDNSFSICEFYEKIDNRIHTFHQENKGVSFARNVGLKNSCGEWIAFCDADDWVEDNWLDLFVSQLNNDVQLVVQGFIPYCREWHGGASGIDFLGGPEEAILKLANNKILGFLQFKMFKSSIIRYAGLFFDVNLKFREDEEFLLRYMKYIQKISCCKVGGYNYVVPDFSAKYNIDCFYSFIKIYKALKDIYGDCTNWLMEDYVKEITQSLFYSFAKNLPDLKHKVFLYRCILGKAVMRQKNLSIFSKWILALVPSSSLVYMLLKVKYLCLKVRYKYVNKKR